MAATKPQALASRCGFALPLTAGMPSLRAYTQSMSDEAERSEVEAFRAQMMRQMLGGDDLGAPSAVTSASRLNLGFG